MLQDVSWWTWSSFILQYIYTHRVRRCLVVQGNFFYSPSQLKAETKKSIFLQWRITSGLLSPVEKVEAGWRLSTTSWDDLRGTWWHDDMMTSGNNHHRDQRSWRLSEDDSWCSSEHQLLPVWTCFSEASIFSQRLWLRSFPTDAFYLLKITTCRNTVWRLGS